MLNLNHSHRTPRKFIDDQRMFWLKSLLDRQSGAMDPQVFAQAEESGNNRSNPWQLVERLTVLRDGQLPSGPWQYLCVTVGAGAGKTTALEQAEYLLLQRDQETLAILVAFSDLPISVNQFLGESLSAARAEKTPLLIAELQKAGSGGLIPDNRSIWQLLHRRIAQGKLTLLVDALDQHRGGLQRAQDTAQALRDFLLRYPKVRCVVSGRPFAVQRFAEQLFRPLKKWEYVQIGLLTPEQCQRMVGQQKWNAIKHLGDIAVGIPRWLELLVELSLEDVQGLKSLSDLYLRSLRNLMNKARAQQAGLVLREEKAWYLFALLAWEMLKDPKGPYRGQNAGVKAEDLPQFTRRIWDERATRNRDTYQFDGLDHDFRDREEFKSLLGQLGALNEMLDSPVIYDTPDDPAMLTRIYWRDQTLQDMFAAVWITRYANDKDREWLATKLFVWWDRSTAEFQDVWKLAAEMPLEDGQQPFVGTDRNLRYAQAMALLYRPQEEGQVVRRSTEMIYRSWAAMQTLERQQGDQAAPAAAAAVAARKGFLAEYLAILQGERGQRAKNVAANFETWFVAIDPQAAGWQSGEEDMDGHPLPVVTERFRLAKYTVTNAVYQLFDAEFQEKYRAYNTRYFGKKSVDSYLNRPRAPAIALSWYDSWCLSVWLQSRLPAEAEWEYACRAGTRKRFAVGDGRTLRQEDARFGLELEDLPIEVDHFCGNAWGLFQMHGNVWEWCVDTADSFSRVVRGGSFQNESINARCSIRFYNGPSESVHDIGCRVARADF
jgi:formylglycine-generating enzyme required for sulfatase activity